MSEVLNVLIKKTERIGSFLEKYPDLPQLLNPLLETPRIPISIAKKSKLSSEQTTLIQLWISVYNYQEDSLFLLLGRRFDAGFGLLRMAAELARDIARMAEDRVNYEMWRNKDELKRRDYYKETFRFNKRNSVEKIVWEQYNIFTNFGIHGHSTSLFHMEKVGNSEDGEFAYIAIPDDAVIRNIGLWMAAFLPVHQMCQGAFQDIIRENEPKALDLIETMQQAVGDSIMALCNYKA